MSQIAQQARALHQQGRLAEAEALYRFMLTETPQEFGPHYFLGVMRLQQGRFAEAAPFFEKALRAKPGDVAALLNLGMALRHMGQPAEALAPLARAISANGDIAEAHYQRAAALHELERMEEAYHAAMRAITLDPGHEKAALLHAMVLAVLERKPEARAVYNNLLQRRPDHVEALFHRAKLVWNGGDAQAALSDLDRATALQPDNADIWYLSGKILRGLERDHDALACFDRAVALKSDFALALADRGFLHWSLAHDYAASKADLTRALELDPSLDWLEGELFFLKMQGAEWDNFSAERAALEKGVAAGRKVVKPFAYQAISSDPASLQRCARILGADQHPALTPAGMAARTTERIRVGYVSAEFREQATAYLMAGVYEAHNAQDFEIIAFDNGYDDASPMRGRLERAFDRFISIAGLSGEAATAAIQNAGIDILVNLNGYFGKPRMDVFARRPAPVQVNYLGFPATLGVPYMDYIIADRIVIPEGERQFYDEAVVWLPGTYQPQDNQRSRPNPDNRAQHGLPQDAFVFCNFNQSYKLTPEIFALWMRLLKSSPNSVLWLLHDRDVANANLRREAEKHGVVAERLIFAPLVPQEEHLARIALGDLFLDTLPYNAHTTCSDALWSGVPVLTCRGTAFPGRVAASLLLAANLPELVTENPGAYEALAIQLAGDPALLAGYRARLTQSRSTCALFDTARFTRHLESAYRTMVQNSRAGLAPQTFSVTP